MAVDGQILVGMNFVQINLVFFLIFRGTGGETLILLVSVAVFLRRADSDRVEAAEAFVMRKCIVEFHAGNDGDGYFGGEI